MSAQFPGRVTVIGGGRMGVGIAHSFAAAGSTVAVVEAGDLAAARQRLIHSLSRADERGKLESPVDVVAGRVEFSAALDDTGADLLVEAVPEDMVLKRSVLTDAEARVSESTVIATNTSSLLVTEMAAVLTRPGRFLGMHFFNPVPASKLVEIVVPVTADPGVVSSVRTGLAHSGKNQSW